MLYAIRQFDARFKRRRHLEPFMDFRSTACRAVECMQQFDAAPFLDSTAWQTEQVGDRPATNAVQPIGMLASFEWQFDRQPFEHSTERIVT